MPKVQLEVFSDLPSLGPVAYFDHIVFSPQFCTLVSLSVVELSGVPTECKDQWETTVHPSQQVDCCTTPRKPHGPLRNSRPADYNPIDHLRPPAKNHVKSGQLVKKISKQWIEAPSVVQQVVLDPHLASCIVHTLRRSPNFRKSFVFYLMQNVFSVHPQPGLCMELRVLLLRPCQYKFDEAWEDRIWIMCMWNELLKEHMAWLFTLGGAFSALGKIGFSSFAEKAGKISVSQLRLSRYLGDPILSCRSRIFFALSLIQRKKFREAQRILRAELVFSRTSEAAAEAEKLESIVRSVWSHLIFEKKQCRSLQQERNLKQRAAKLMFDEKTIRNKKSLADTILAMSAMNFMAQRD